ncbi:MAG: ATP-binding protein [Candidatus Caenarcaniphilales bacterium]|jgi:predicted AAA+ superfamily ATPase|nr:ATP-binding protein [Candidatus Caenarcaniphilales bacterium]
MYQRFLENPLKKEQSFFLFGPRGSGKSYWLMHQLPKESIFFNLLDPETRIEFISHPSKLVQSIAPGFKGWIVIDEIQKAPSLLDLVHKLIEEKNYKFILTSSSARTLRKLGVNLLAGRAHTYHMYPLTSQELGKDFDLRTALSFGMLPKIYDSKITNAKKYLSSYTKTYLYEEVMQEGLSRNLEAFSRFLEAASFSQASVLNISSVARDIGINARTVSNYFDLLEDMLIAYRLNVFNKKAKRKLISHSKFYFFDVGVYQTIRPKGILDSGPEIEGHAIETLVLQELIALNSYYELDYQIQYWRTINDQEVDFILYGPSGFWAIEVKRSSNIGSNDLKSLKLFLSDYPEAKGILVYGGKKKLYFENNIEAIPLEDFFAEIKSILESKLKT